MVEVASPGRLIVFEGIDGSGLTTHATRLAQWLGRQGHPVYLTKQPSHGPIGAVIRMGLSGRLALDSAALSLMFAADRLDHLASDIEPKLASGVSVICDRYYLSSFAYQSLDLDLSWIMSINGRARRPDLTVFLDVPAHVTCARIAKERHNVELFETESTLRDVRDNYHRIIGSLRQQGECIVIVPGYTDKGIRPINDTANDIRAVVCASLGLPDQQESSAS